MIEQLKSMNIRLKYDDWRFFREYAFNKGVSMNSLLAKHIKHLRDKNEKKDEKGVDDSY